MAGSVIYESLRYLWHRTAIERDAATDHPCGYCGFWHSYLYECPIARRDRGADYYDDVPEAEDQELEKAHRNIESITAKIRMLQNRK